MIGQVRGISLDEFLSDWEPQGQALPWAVGDNGWVSEPKTESPAVARAEREAGRRRGTPQSQSREPSVKPAADAGYVHTVLSLSLIHI